MSERPKRPLKLPWYPVPAYRGGMGYQGSHHVVNATGELVATFEALADAEAACRAINNREGEG